MSNGSKGSRYSFNVLSTVFLIGLLSLTAQGQLQPSNGLSQRVSRKAYAKSASSGMPLVSIFNLHFQSSDYTAGGDTYDIASGDFDGNGYPDVVTANIRANSVSVFLNSGNGSWQPHVDYAVGNAPNSVAVGDFNGDGKLDIAVCNGADGTVSVLLGNGDGAFQPQKVSTVGGNGFVHSLAAGDFNHDGKADLAVTLYQYEDGSGGLAVLLSNGDGTFQAPVFHNVASGALGVAAGDLNHDGNLDLAVTTWCYACGPNDRVSILLGNGDGSFQPHVDYQVQDEPNDIALGDFNGDGKLDLAVANFCGADPYCQGFAPPTVSILLGHGDGTFQPQTAYPVASPDGRIAVADFNGDGKRDLAVPAPYNNIITLMVGNGDGTFQAQQFSTGSHMALGVVAGQFNSGGISSADMVLADWDSYNGNTITEMANEAGTHVSLTSSPNPSNYGQAVTFTVTIAAAVPGSGTPSGTITFYNGQETATMPPSLQHVIGTASLVNGVATLQFSNLPHGNNWITAWYTGDTNFNPNSARGLVQVVH